MRSRTLRVDGDEWSRLEEEVHGGSRHEVAGVLAVHRDAPVRALLKSAAGDRGARTRLTMVGGEVVLVTRRLARIGAETRIEPGALITFSDPEGLWAAVAATLPDTDLLRAPAPMASAADERRELPADGAEQLLASEELNLHVRVEAWRGGAAPAVVWARWWSVVEDRLIDVRTRGDELRLVERPAGSVARELRWALVGAVDATTRSDAGSSDVEAAR